MELKIKKVEFEPDEKVKEPEFLIDTTKGKDMTKGFTLVVTFSRKWCVRPFFDAFNKLDIDIDNCHLVLIDNSANKLLEDALRPYMEVYSEMFYTTRWFKTYRTGGGDRRGAEDKGFWKSKLPQIYWLHLDMIKLLTTEKFVLLEDDTLPPPDAVPALLKMLEDDEEIGIATGIATGRSPFRHNPQRLGVHYFNRVGNKLLERYTPDPDQKGSIEVDACGWYCCASYSDIWADGFVGMSEYLDKIPRFALDGYHTNNLKRDGWKIVANFDLTCEHMNICPEGIIHWRPENAIRMLDVWLPKYKMYATDLKLSETNARQWINDSKNVSLNFSSKRPELATLHLFENSAQDDKGSADKSS